MSNNEERDWDEFFDECDEADLDFAEDREPWAEVHEKLGFYEERLQMIERAVLRLRAKVDG